MSNIPKNPIIGQASEFEKHLQKQEELVRDAKNKGPARYYANRKPEWATDANEDEDDGANIFIQQPQQSTPLNKRPGEGFLVNITSTEPPTRERPRRRREKVAATVVSVNEDASSISDPRLRRLLKNEKQKIEQEESQNTQLSSENIPTSRGGRRQRIRAEIIQHQKEFENQGHATIEPQMVSHLKQEDDTSKIKPIVMDKENEEEKNDNIVRSRRELREAIKTKELGKRELKESKPTHDIISGKVDISEGNSLIKEELNEEEEEEGDEDEDDDDNEEEEEEDDEEDEWPEMAPPSFIPREERILPKIEECLEREEEYFKQSEINRKKRGEEEAKKKLQEGLAAGTIGVNDNVDDEALKNTSMEDLDDEDENEALEEWKKREAERIRLETLERESFEKGSLKKGRDEAKAKRDSEKVKPWRPKEKWRYLQKYYHSGAFFKDGGEWDVDANGKWNFDMPTGEDAWVDKANLPKVLQVRNFGKRKQTKHTNLRDEDTTEFGDNDRDTESFLKKMYDQTKSKMASFSS